MKADKIHIYRFDNIKVFLMILVIIAHTLINSYGDKGMEYIRFFCLCYTMPLFTFISGYLSKREQHFKKNIIYLLLPCFVFTVINDLVEELVNLNYVFNWRQPGFAMWYLWVLFVFRVVLPYLIRVKYILLLSFILSWLVGFVPFVGTNYSLSRLCCFLPYFLLGYMVANDNFYSLRYKMLIKNTPPRAACLVLFLAFVAWSCVILLRPGLTFATAFNYGYGGNIIGLILRIALQITIIVTGCCVLKIFPERKFFYTKFGERTLSVYLLHGLVVLPFAYLVFPSFGNATLIEKILMIILPTSCCILLFSDKVYMFMGCILKRK